MGNKQKGFIAAIIAYFLWGIFPIYWKFLLHVNSFEIVFHRVLWSFLFLNIILFFSNKIKETFTYLKNIEYIKYFFLTSLLIGSNWFLYIWAVNTNKILETSLGYYMAPLFNVVFAKLFLKERMRKGQIVAFISVLCAILNMLIGLNHFPWIALTLAITFSLYGLFRKQGKLGSLQGLFIETFLISIPSLAFIIILMFLGKGSFLSVDIKTDLLLILSGPMTAIPLIAFAYGARRLKFITMGIIQYLAPTIAFLVGVFLYNEPFTVKHLITFFFIWSAITIYVIDAYILYK